MAASDKDQTKRSLMTSHTNEGQDSVGKNKENLQLNDQMMGQNSENTAMDGFPGYMGPPGGMLAMPSLTPPPPPGFSLGRMPVYGPMSQYVGKNDRVVKLEKAQKLQAEKKQKQKKEKKQKERNLFFYNPMMAYSMMGMHNPYMWGMGNPMLGAHHAAAGAHHTAAGAYHTTAGAHHTIAGAHHTAAGMHHHGMASMHHGMGLNPFMNPYMMFNPMLSMMFMNPYMMYNPAMMMAMGGGFGFGQQNGANNGQQDENQEKQQPFSPEDENKLRRKLTNQEINTIFYPGEMPDKMQREMNLQENLSNAELNEQMGSLEGVSKQDTDWLKEMDNRISTL